MHILYIYLYIHTHTCPQVTAAMAGGASTLLDDGSFIYPTAVYRSAGVAIPVSGLKSNDSMGVGEFSDLRKLVDWCALTGLQLIQVMIYTRTRTSHAQQIGARSLGSS